MVINETFARLHWQGQSPVGHRISINGPGEMLTVVSVVRDVRERGFEPDTKPGVYFPNTQVSGTTFVPEVMVGGWWFSR